MASLLKIIGICLLTVVAFVVIKPLKPELALFVSMAGSIVVLIMCIDSLTEVIQTMTSFVEKTGINNKLFSSVLKIIGIGYITDFSCSLCSSSGNSLIADIMAFAGKITIVVMSLPILNSIIEIILGILP